MDQRITSVTVDGRPLDPNASYRVGTLSFLATGGDNYRAFTQGTDYVDTGLLDYEAWIDYLGDHSPVGPSYAKHAVSVTGAPDAAAPGDALTLQVSGLNLTSRGAPENTSLVASIGGVELGSFAVSGGAATVTLTLPADTPVGAAQLLLSAPSSGTVVTVPLTIEPGVAASTTALSLTKTDFVVGARGAVTATATVSADAPVSGTIEFVVDGTVLASAPVRDGGATAQLSLPGTLGVGTHQVMARYLGSDEVSASESASVAITVQAATSRTTLLPVLPVQMNGLLHSTLFAFVTLDSGQSTSGKIEFREGTRVVATVQVRGGVASTTLPKLSRGSHSFTAVFVPSDPATTTGSTSTRASVLVLF
jgi:5'-nucleotidase